MSEVGRITQLSEKNLPKNPLELLAEINKLRTDNAALRVRIAELEGELELTKFALHKALPPEIPQTETTT